jgi:hypothetical protein
MEETDPEAKHGQYGYELGIYGKCTEDYIA